MPVPRHAVTSPYPPPQGARIGLRELMEKWDNGWDHRDAEFGPELVRPTSPATVRALMDCGAAPEDLAPPRRRDFSHLPPAVAAAHLVEAQRARAGLVERVAGLRARAVEEAKARAGPSGAAAAAPAPGGGGAPVAPEPTGSAPGRPPAWQLEA